MGWTGIYRQDCIKNKRGNIDRRKTIERELSYGTTEVVKGAMAGGNYYCVLRYPDLMGNERNVLCVTLIRTNGDELVYKPMDDTWGPVYYDCPKSILDLADRLCPCDEAYDPHGYARKWRERCREQIRVRNAPTAFAKCKPWDQVLWHVPADSGITCGGKSLAGRTLKLTKEPRRRQWQCYELCARVATKFVNPLDCELVDEEAEWRSFTHIKGWYVRTYPTDDLGNELDEGVTFKDLYDRMSAGEDVYEVMGVGDSVIRERLFEELADRRGVDYDEIYQLWMKAA